MIINLSKSTLFTVEPAKRFAKQFRCDERVWIDCWLKYKLLDLRTNELGDYVYIKTGKKLNNFTVRRWIIRTEIYSHAREAFKMGTHIVTSQFFGKWEEYVMDELLRNMKSSAHHRPRTIV